MLRRNSKKKRLDEIIGSLFSVHPSLPTQSRKDTAHGPPVLTLSHHCTAEPSVPDSQKNFKGLLPNFMAAEVSDPLQEYKASHENHLTQITFQLFLYEYYFPQTRTQCNVCPSNWKWAVSQGLPHPAPSIDVAELKLSSCSYIFQGLRKTF